MLSQIFVLLFAVVALLVFIHAFGAEIAFYIDLTMGK